jgi:hypothetical protein
MQLYHSAGLVIQWGGSAPKHDVRSLWPENPELVLHYKIIGDAPMPPELEAWNVW